MTPDIDIIRFLEDPNLLGKSFRGPSWQGWKTILKAGHALPMTREERAFFATVAHRDPPSKRVKEFWIVAGQRAGKDSIASALATHAACRDYKAHLRPGEVASIFTLAVDRDQANIVYRYIRANFADNKLFRNLVKPKRGGKADALSGAIALTTGAEITVATRAFRQIRGRSLAMAILDELAFWTDESSATPDAEVYRALVPSLVTIPKSLLIGISSPYKKSGLLYQKWRDHFGREDDDVLVINATTRQLNPTIPQELVDQALEADPAAARASWLGEFRDDLSSFIERELVEAAVDRGVIVRPPEPSCVYTAFVDPSGGRADSFTLGIAHIEDDKVVLDALVEIEPPFNASESVRLIADTLRQYRISQVTGDRWGAEWVVQAFAAAGVRYEASDRDRSALYADALPLFTSGRVRLLDSKKLVNQIASLERRVMTGGRDKIDHPPNLHDDLANAACGALALAADVQAPLKINPAFMEQFRARQKMTAAIRSSGVDPTRVRSTYFGGRSPRLAAGSSRNDY